MDAVHLDSRDARTLWGEISPSQHFAQFYRDEATLLDTLTGFVGAGLNAGETAIVIATPQHMRTLRLKLAPFGVDMERALREDRFVTLDAATALSSFMLDEMPDEGFFTSFVEGLLRRANRGDRRVRVFSETMALLWGDGLAEATVRLESLWHSYCERRSLSMFCGYPRTAFTKDASESLAQICALHSHVV
jgi:MEDS: MEthanogen/methylotroph, DcmR Sensory domain